MRVFPCADRRFRNDQEMIFYFNVYNPGVDDISGHPKVAVSLSLVRDGRPVGLQFPIFELSELESQPLPHIQVARAIKMGNLPPGIYVLRAEVLDRSRGKAITTQASFELVP